MTLPNRDIGPCESACLIHVGAIGDFILALRVVASLRAQWPNVRIDVLGRRDIASVAIGRGGVDAATSVERLRLHPLFAETGPVDATCREYLAAFQVIVNMHTGAEATFARRLGGVTPARVITIDPAPRDPTRHVTDGWMDDLRDAGVTPSPDPPTLTFGADDRLEGRRRLHDLIGIDDRPIVLLHPGSGGRAKCWPAESFAGLASWLRHADVQPVFVLGPVEMERHGTEMVDRLSRLAPTSAEPDLLQTALAIAAADAYVGNDAGPTHLAAAAGTPTVALFGPTDATVWRPLGNGVVVVEGRPAGTFDGVTVERVGAAVLTSLRRRRSTFG